MRELIIAFCNFAKFMTIKSVTELSQTIYTMQYLMNVD